MLALGPADLDVFGVVTAAAVVTAGVAAWRRRRGVTLRGYAVPRMPVLSDGPAVD